MNRHVQRLKNSWWWARKFKRKKESKIKVFNFNFKFFLLNHIMLYITRKLFKNTVKWHLFYLFIFIRRAVASFWICGSLLFFDDFWQIQTPRFRKRLGVFAQKLSFFLVYIKTNFAQIFIKIWDGDLKCVFKMCWFDMEWPLDLK